MDEQSLRALFEEAARDIIREDAKKKLGSLGRLADAIGVNREVFYRHAALGGTDFQLDELHAVTRALGYQLPSQFWLRVERRVRSMIEDRGLDSDLL